ncbi:porin family protein [Flavitalea flava]
MLENKFDEFFRNKLLGHTSQIPEDMWERIRQRDRNRNPFPFWPWRIIGPALLVLGLAGAYFLVGAVKRNSKIRENTLSRVEFPTYNPNPGKYPKNGKDTHDGNNTNNKKNNNTSNNNNVKTVKNFHELYSNRKNSIEAVTDKGNTSIFNLDQYFIDQPKTDQPNIDQPNIDQPKTDQPNIDQTKQNISFASKKASQIRHNHGAYSTSSYPVDKARLYQLDSTLTENKKELTQTTFIKDNVNRKGDSLDHRKSFPDSQTPFHNGKNWHLEVYISPDAPFQSITPNNAPGPELLQKGQLSYTAGLKVSKSFTSHFTGQIGIQYSQINIKLSKSDTLVTISGDRQLKSLDIPLLIGYEMGNDRFKMAINAGVILNAYSWSKGSYSTPNGNLYRQNTGTSLYLGLCFTHTLDEKFSLFAEPYYRYRTTDMTNQHQVFSQKFNTLGLSIGLRYNFNRNRQRR